MKDNQGQVCHISLRQLISTCIASFFLSSYQSQIYSKLPILLQEFDSYCNLQWNSSVVEFGAGLLLLIDDDSYRATDSVGSQPYTGKKQSHKYWLTIIIKTI